MEINNNCISGNNFIIWDSFQILTDVQKGGWIDVESPKVSSDGKSFLTLTSQYQGEKWYRHILLYTRDTITKPITSGDFSVDAILKWDEARNRMYAWIILLAYLGVA